MRLTERTPNSTQRGGGGPEGRAEGRHPAVSALVFGVSLVLAAGGLWTAWKDSRTTAGIDFFGCWGVPKALAHCYTKDVYSSEGHAAMGWEIIHQVHRSDTPERLRVASENIVRARSLKTPQTPFCYAAWNAFSGGDYERDYTVFTLFSLACFAWAVISLCRLFGYSYASALLMLAVLTFAFVPLISEMRVANLNRIQLAGLAAVLFLQARSYLGIANLMTGVVMGLLVMLKPNLLVVICLPFGYWLWRRNGRRFMEAAGGMALGALFALTVSAAYFRGFDCWRGWGRTLPEVWATWYTVWEGNYGFIALARYLTGLNLSSVILGACLAIALAAVVQNGRRRGAAGAGGEPGDAAREETAAIAALLALGCGIMLLSMRLVWTHYYVLAIPLVLFACRPRPGYAPDEGRTGGSAGGLALPKTLFPGLGRRARPPAEPLSSSADDEVAVRRPARAWGRRAVAFLALAMMTRLPYPFLPASQLTSVVLLNGAVLILAGVCLYELWTNAVGIELAKGSGNNNRTVVPPP